MKTTDNQDFVIYLFGALSIALSLLGIIWIVN